MRGRLFVSIFLLLGAVNADAQQNLSVNIDDPIYFLLEYAEIQGALESVSKVKPYTFTTVLSLLERAAADKTHFTEMEGKILLTLLADWTGRRGTPPPGEIGTEGNLGVVNAGVRTESLFQVNLGALDDWHMYNAVRLFFSGDITESLSYYACLGLTYDRVNPAAFVPYSFTKQWDGLHFGPGEPRYSYDGIEPVPYFSFILENEITLQAFDDNLAVKFARFRRDVSLGDGSLFLSSTARPFYGVDLSARLAPWLNLSFTVGSLGDWVTESWVETTGLTFQKMISAQLIEFFPAPWLYLSSGTAVIWGKRFEIGYLNPIMNLFIHQNLHGDFDNLVEELKVAVFIPGLAKLYFCFFIDEMELTDPVSFVKRPRNMVAIQGGIRAPIPLSFLPFTLLTVQYTKIEPFVYTHYPEGDLSSSSMDVDLSYTHDGENLGYRLPPNSDELLVKLETMPRENLRVGLSYRLIRHGTNAATDPYQPLIYGGVTEYFHYDLADLYPDKSFLNDGFYDWNHIVSLEASFKIPGTPVVLTGSYSFIYTFFVVNASGMAPRQDELKNIISLRVNVF